MSTTTTQSLKPNAKDIKISAYKGGIKSVIPQTVKTLTEIVKGLQSDELKELTAAMVNCTDPQAKQQLKLKQPFITPYGTFSYRENKSILHHNCFLVALDIDKLTTEQAAAVIAILIQNESCTLCYISGSQKGVKALVLLNGALPLASHYKTLTTNAALLLEALGLVQYAEYLDFAQFALCQAMFLSYNANLYYNPEATPLNIELVEYVEVKTESLPIRDVTDYSPNTQLRIEAYVNNAVESLIFKFENHTGPRHNEIANVKGIAGLYKGYSLANESEVYERLLNAAVELYDSEAEAKAANVYTSFATAWNAAEPLRNETIESILGESPDYFATDHEINRLKYRIDVKEDIPRPQIAWSLKNVSDDKTAILGTLGNFSLVIGKAKAKKSFFINIAVSTALSKSVTLERFTSDLPEEQNEVLYIDTEQGKYHVQAAIKRICEQINEPEPKNLHAYFLRSLTPLERLKFIEAEIYSNPRLGFVIIDGIKDLVTPINDEEQATNIASKLLKWTEERNIHIVTVLHQNKSDANARGHIGTELINKAETVLEVAKSDTEPLISIVTALQCRNIEPEPFAFEIDVFGLPIAAENYEMRTETKSKRFDVTDLEDSKKYELLQQVYSNGQSFGYKELETQIKLASKIQLGKELGTNSVTALITYCKNNSWLIQEKPKAPYTIGAYNLSL